MAEARTRVLNVNDDGATRYSLSRMLRQGGFELSEAVTGIEALEAAAHLPDLIVLDVNLPDLSGFEVCQRLKASPRTRGIPVLMVSARYVELDAKIRGLEIGADAYLVQPVEAAELVATVNALLRMRRAEQHAQELSHQWQATFDATTDGIAVLDAQGRLARWNRSLERLVGEGTRLEAGVRLMELLGASEAAQDGARELKRGGHWLRIRRDALPAVAAGAPGPDVPAPAGSVVVVADVTQTRALLEEVSQRAEQLAQADRRKDEFLAMLAHELRNPLAAISAGAQMLDRVGADPARSAKMRELVRRQTRHLARLVDDLLDISRITRGKVLLQRQTLELGGLLRQAVLTQRARAEARRIALGLDEGATPLWVEADPTRLEQIVANLIDNALKYTQEGGRVSVRSWAEDGSARIAVEDNGIGIAPAQQSTIFELFAQADPEADRASAGGLGIGLTLVQRMTELHGGTVAVHSAGKGQGSTFTVALPLRPAPSADPVRPSAGGDPGASAPSARRVLLVEDNPDAREAMRDLLEDWGLAVEVESDGARAAERILSLRPDVALVDIGLPGVDGYGVARQVRQAPQGRALRLIALTGYGGSQQRRDALEAGFDLHLVKPVEPDELRRVLDAGASAAGP